MNSRLYICLSVWMVLAASPLPGQEALRPLYDSLFQTQNHLINGKVVRGGVPTGNGHPYFGASGWQSGIVTMEGMRIPCNAIRYDLLTDQVLIHHFSKSGSHVIQVTSAFAGEFELGDHRFCYLDQYRFRDAGMKPGYYEAAYLSDTELWIKWEKAYREGSAGPGRFEQIRNFYIMKEHIFFRITGKRSLLDVFPDMEAELKAFLRKQGISVRRAETDDLIGVVRFYENTKNSQF